MSLGFFHGTNGGLRFRFFLSTVSGIDSCGSPPMVLLSVSDVSSLISPSSRVDIVVKGADALRCGVVTGLLFQVLCYERNNSLSIIGASKLFHSMMVIAILEGL